jgi:hypothetical protein
MCIDIPLKKLLQPVNGTETGTGESTGLPNQLISGYDHFKELFDHGI